VTWLLLLGGLFVAMLARVRSRYILIIVDGISMAPTVQPGQRLVVRRADLTSVRRGSLVVVGLGGLMVKRAVALPGDPVPPGIPVDDAVVPAGRLVVLGDNAAHSFDSRRAGYVRAADVVGVVISPAFNGASRWERGPEVTLLPPHTRRRWYGGRTRAR